MSRTIRKGKKYKHPQKFYGWAPPPPKGNSKPYHERYPWREGKAPYKCHCIRCIDGNLHRHARQPQMFDYEGFEPPVTLEEWIESIGETPWWKTLDISGETI